MLESSSYWPSRECIERADMNQYDRLQAETSALGSNAMFTTRGNGRKPKSSPGCPMCSRTGHAAQGCREYTVTVDQKTNGQRSSYRNRRGGYGGRNDGRKGGGSKFKHRNSTSESPTDGENKRTPSGCSFCKHSGGF